jgi:hypothetical protein
VYSNLKGKLEKGCLSLIGSSFLFTFALGFVLGFVLGLGVVVTFFFAVI